MQSLSGVLKEYYILAELHFSFKVNLVLVCLNGGIKELPKVA